VVKKSPGRGIWLSWHRNSQQRAKIRSSSYAYLGLYKDALADQAVLGTDQTAEIRHHATLLSAVARCSLRSMIWHRRSAPLAKSCEIAGKSAPQSRLVDLVPEAPASVEFGRFRILPHRREVLADGRPIELGGRAFDVLIALIEANGAVVGKDELISRAWPARIIEESNLRAQIKALRMALGDPDLIRTVAGGGYQFTGVVRRSGGRGEVR
jgi:DNA-binding winged helix-turn-helix (wHTH) protein